MDFAQRVGFIQHDGCVGQQIEEAFLRAGHRGVQLPSGKDGDAGRAHRLLDGLLAAGEALGRQAGVDRGQGFLFHRRLGQGKQNHFLADGGGALRGRIELANRFDLVAKELDAHRTIGFRRINIEQAAAMRELSRHLDDIHLAVSHDAQVLQQTVGVADVAAANHLGQVGIEAGGAQAHRGRSQRDDHDFRRTGRDLPQRRRALLLDLGMGRQIFEGQNVIGWQSDDRVGRNCAGQIGHGAQGREQLFRRTIVANNNGQRTRRRPRQQRIEQSLSRGSKSGHTCPLRAPFLTRVIARVKAGTFSTSAKSSRTNGRIIA